MGKEIPRRIPRGRDAVTIGGPAEEGSDSETPYFERRERRKGGVREGCPTEIGETGDESIHQSNAEPTWVREKTKGKLEKSEKRRIDSKALGKEILDPR